METQQHDTKQPMDHWRNKRGNQKIPRSKWKQRHNNPKPIGCSKSSSKREDYRNTSLPEKTKISNKQPNFTPKATIKKKKNKTQSYQK